MKFGKNSKKSKVDYRSEMLPKNRVEVFFDVVKLQWSNFLLYGLLFFVAFLPLNVLSINKIFAVSDLTDAIAIAQESQVETLKYQLSLVKDTYALMQGGAFVLVFLFLAGFVKVVRQYAWGENVFFVSDFTQGFKSNCFQFVILGILFGVLFAFSSILYNWAQETTKGFFESLCLMVPACLFLLVVIPVVCYDIVATAIYKNNFFGNLKLAFSVAFANPVLSLVALLCCFAVCFLLLIPSVACIVIFRAIIPFSLPFVLLAWTLFAFNQFDKYVNALHFPQLVGKGTFSPKGETIASDNDN